MTTNPRPPAEIIKELAALIADHNSCIWEQIGPCVYCTDHHVRLYQGQLPQERRTVPKCVDGQHDWDPDMGFGFYVMCRICSYQEWFE